MLLSLIACFASSPYGEDVIPLEEDVRINLPTDPAAAKTATDADAEWATFYVMTRNVTEDVNGMITFVLGTVGFVVTLRPTWVDEEEQTALWGPYSDSGLDPVETGLFVTRNADASYTWTLFQEPPGSDPLVDAVPIVVGEVDAGSRRHDAAGRFVVDFDTAASLDPAVNRVGAFAVAEDASAPRGSPPGYFACWKNLMHASREDVLHHVPLDIREAEIAACIFVGQLFVIHAEQVQERRVQIVDVDFVLLREVAVVVGRAVRDAGLHAAAGHPHREAVRIMIAPVAALRGGRAAKFPAPKHERIVEQAARF